LTSRLRWDNKVKMDLKKIGWEDMDWIDIVQDRENWQVLVNTLLKLEIPWNGGNFLTSWATVSFSSSGVPGGGGGVSGGSNTPPRNSEVFTKLSQNNLKVLKIKKIWLYEMKCLVPNHSCLQNPWLGGYHLQIPVLSVLNWICWITPPEQNSWLRHCSQDILCPEELVI
jgi:hypothetical protein